MYSHFLEVQQSSADVSFFPHSDLYYKAQNDLEFKKNKEKLEREMYEKKMRELNEFQDMLYSETNNSNQHLLPTRRRNKRNQTAEEKPQGKKELTEAEKRMIEIDNEVQVFLEKSKEDRENSADI